jgi:hypothetical protein
LGAGFARYIGSEEEPPRPPALKPFLIFLTEYVRPYPTNYLVVRNNYANSIAVKTITLEAATESFAVGPVTRPSFVETCLNVPVDVSSNVCLIRHPRPTTRDLSNGGVVLSSATVK